MNAFFSSVFFFIVAIGVLITVHEFGHFWVARRLGVKVLRFSIGFGRPLLSWRRKNDETEYVLAAIPLGGYVQMLDEREGPVAESETARAFNRKPVGSRLAIVAAGPLANFLFAIVAYWLMFVIGVSGIKPLIGDVQPDSLAGQGGFRNGDLILTIDGRRVQTWNGAFLALMEESLEGRRVEVEVRDESGIRRLRVLDFGSLPEGVDRSSLMDNLGLRPYSPPIPPVIGRLEPGGVAAQAGLEAGDRILEVDGRPVDDWRAWVDIVRRHPGQPLRVRLSRGEEVLTLTLTPEVVETSSGRIGRIGAAVSYPGELLKEMMAVERYSPLASLGVAMARTWDMTLLTFRMLWRMVVGDVSVANLGGPIRIAQYAGYSASAGFVSFIGFLALISISLGVLNLLPIPVLDGGHLLYYTIEAVKGSPLSEEVQALGQRLGIAILIGVMVIAFYNDLVQLFG
ncbi:MAG TPA: RIP metalloprotease RseP [Gammaproteobacteria bacterium]|nr:RIP metalloprotease RseP [Gammaproteobacteria bacterium]